MSHEGMYMVTLMVPVYAESLADAHETAVRAVSHTPLGHSVVRAEPVAREDGEIGAEQLLEHGKWVASVYPVVVRAARKESRVLESWGRFLCEAEEGVGEP